MFVLLRFKLIIKYYFDFNLKIRSRLSHRHQFIMVISPFKEVFIKYKWVLGLDIDSSDYLHGIHIYGNF